MLVSKAHLKHKTTPHGYLNLKPSLNISRGQAATSSTHHAMQLKTHKIHNNATSAALPQQDAISQKDREMKKGTSRAPMHQADIITFTFKANTEAFLHRLISRYNWMFFPRTAVVTAQNGHFTLSATQ